MCLWECLSIHREEHLMRGSGFSILLSGNLHSGLSKICITKQNMEPGLTRYWQWAEQIGWELTEGADMKVHVSVVMDGHPNAIWGGWGSDLVKHDKQSGHCEPTVVPGNEENQVWKNGQQGPLIGSGCVFKASATQSPKKPQDSLQYGECFACS